MLQVIVLIVFLVLSTNRACRLAALFFCAAQLIYMIMLPYIDWTLLFHANALLSVILGFITISKFRLFAILSFFMVPVCFIGYTLCEKFYPATAYDTMSLLIIIGQALSLFFRIPTDARYYNTDNKFFMVRCVDFNIYKQSNLMQSKGSKKK